MSLVSGVVPCLLGEMETSRGSPWSSRIDWVEILCKATVVNNYAFVGNGISNRRFCPDAIPLNVECRKVRVDFDKCV